MGVVDINQYLVGRRKNILIVDDSASARRLLSKFLQKYGFTVYEAEDGAQGMDVLNAHEIATIICDWEMPVMNGLQFCRAVRKNFDADEHYILMLTGNTERNAIRELFDAGGDDYLTKPVDTIALSARLLGGLRTVSWRDDLKWTHAELADRTRQLDEAYAKIREDLVVAESVQRRHLPSDYSAINDVVFAGAYRPAFHTAGDIFNYVRLSETEIGVYSVDVSGHGVASSLLAVTLAEVLCTNGVAQPILLDQSETGAKARMPDAVVADLNARFLHGETDHYFTLTYGVIDAAKRELRFCQAGHPPLLVMDSGGGSEVAGFGGLPVGMFDFAEYETVHLSLKKGDRVFLFSDGIPETENSDGEQFGEIGMIRELSSSNKVPIADAISSLIDSACVWQGGCDFSDDVSVLGFEFSV